MLEPSFLGIKPEDTETLIISPNGVSHTCVLVESDDDYSIKFIPKELGIHTASVKKGVRLYCTITLELSPPVHVQVWTNVFKLNEYNY